MVEIKNINFNEYDWHDSIITNIIIDRVKPGIKDIVHIDIIYPDSNKGYLLFNDVYWANLNMNFGIVSTESIFDTYVTKEDKILKDFYLKWKGMLDNIELLYYVINLNSTKSKIEIIAKDLKIVRLP